MLFIPLIYKFFAIKQQCFSRNYNTYPMENQEEVPLSKESCGLLCETRTNFRPLFRSLYHKFPPSVSEAVPSGIPVSISGTRYVFSVILEHAQNTRARGVPAVKGSSLSLQQLFLSFPFGTRVSTDGMDGTDSGWRSLLSNSG